MVHGKNRIPYRIDRSLNGLAGPDYDATISFGLPFEPEDSQYGKSRFNDLTAYTGKGLAGYDRYIQYVPAHFLSKSKLADDRYVTA